MRSRDLEYLDGITGSHTLMNFICITQHHKAIKLHAVLDLDVVKESAYHCGHEIPFPYRNFSRGGLVFLFSSAFATVEFGLVLGNWSWAGKANHT